MSSLALVKANDLQVVSYLTDTSGLLARPCKATFLPGDKPYLAVVQENPLPCDTDNVPLHIVRIDCDRGNRVLISNHTATSGMYLYEVPVDHFATGGLKLADLKPTLTGSSITRDVAIVP